MSIQRDGALARRIRIGNELSRHYAALFLPRQLPSEPVAVVVDPGNAGHKLAYRVPNVQEPSAAPVVLVDEMSRGGLVSNAFHVELVDPGEGKRPVSFLVKFRNEFCGDAVADFDQENMGHDLKRHVLDPVFCSRQLDDPETPEGGDDDWVMAVDEVFEVQVPKPIVPFRIAFDHQLKRVVFVYHETGGGGDGNRYSIDVVDLWLLQIGRMIRRFFHQIGNMGDRGVGLAILVPDQTPSSVVQLLLNNLYSLSAGIRDLSLHPRFAQCVPSGNLNFFNVQYESQSNVLRSIDEWKRTEPIPGGGTAGLISVELGSSTTSATVYAVQAQEGQPERIDCLENMVAKNLGSVVVDQAILVWFLAHFFADCQWDALSKGDKERLQSNKRSFLRLRFDYFMNRSPKEVFDVLANKFHVRPDELSRLLTRCSEFKERAFEGFPLLNGVTIDEYLAANENRPVGFLVAPKLFSSQIPPRMLTFGVLNRIMNKSYRWHVKRLVRNAIQRARGANLTRIRVSMTGGPLQDSFLPRRIRELPLEFPHMALDFNISPDYSVLAKGGVESVEKDHKGLLAQLLYHRDRHFEETESKAEGVQLGRLQAFFREMQFALALLCPSSPNHQRYLIIEVGDSGVSLRESFMELVSSKLAPMTVYVLQGMSRQERTRWIPIAVAKVIPGMLNPSAPVGLRTPPPKLLAELWKDVEDCPSVLSGCFLFGHLLRVSWHFRDRLFQFYVKPVIPSGSTILAQESLQDLVESLVEDIDSLPSHVARIVLVDKPEEPIPIFQDEKSAERLRVADERSQRSLRKFVVESPMSFQSADVDSQQRISDRLRNFGLLRLEQSPFSDLGDCQFDALAQLINPGASFLALPGIACALRHDVCEWIEKNQDELSDFVLGTDEILLPGETMDGYLLRMRIPCQWGDNLTLFAASCIRNARIVLVSATSEGNNCWLFDPVEFRNREMVRLPVTNVWHLLYYPYLHYEALTLIDQVHRRDVQSLFSDKPVAQSDLFGRFRPGQHESLRYAVDSLVGEGLLVRSVGKDGVEFLEKFRTERQIGPSAQKRKTFPERDLSLEPAKRIHMDLPDEEDEREESSGGRTKAKRRRKKRPRPVAGADVVIVISSDDDEDVVISTPVAPSFGSFPSSPVKVNRPWVDAVREAMIEQPPMRVREITDLAVQFQGLTRPMNHVMRRKREQVVRARISERPDLFHRVEKGLYVLQSTLSEDSSSSDDSSWSSSSSSASPRPARKIRRRSPPSLAPAPAPAPAPASQPASTASRLVPPQPLPPVAALAPAPPPPPVAAAKMSFPNAIKAALEEKGTWMFVAELFPEVMTLRNEKPSAGGSVRKSISRTLSKHRLSSPTGRHLFVRDSSRPGVWGLAGWKKPVSVTEASSTSQQKKVSLRRRGRKKQQSSNSPISGVSRSRRHRRGRNQRRRRSKKRSKTRRKQSPISSFSDDSSSSDSDIVSPVLGSAPNPFTELSEKLRSQRSDHRRVPHSTPKKKATSSNLLPVRIGTIAWFARQSLRVLRGDERWIPLSTLKSHLKKSPRWIAESRRLTRLARTMRERKDCFVEREVDGTSHWMLKKIPPARTAARVAPAAASPASQSASTTSPSKLSWKAAVVRVLSLNFPTPMTPQQVADESVRLDFRGQINDNPRGPAQWALRDLASKGLHGVLRVDEMKDGRMTEFYRLREK